MKNQHRSARRIQSQPAADARGAAWELTPLSRALRVALAGSSLFAYAAAQAGPQGEVVQGGVGSVSRPDAATTLINQGSPRLALQWNSFNVAPHEHVQFVQPGPTAVALNRIVDVAPSQIFGRVSANGHLILANPNGVLFGRTSHVRTGNLTAAAMDVDVGNFMAGRANLAAVDGTAGTVVNQGLLEAASGGAVTLIGRSVRNEGVIVARQGQVTLAAGEQATVDFTGDGLLQIAVDGQVDANPTGTAAAVQNDGRIEAAGGQVLLTASAARDVFSRVVVNNGLVTAGAIDTRGGTVRLVARGANAGVLNTGTVDASGTQGGQVELTSAGRTELAGSGSVTSRGTAEAGGEVKLLGESVALLDSASVDVSGALGGGRALVGGNYQGRGPERNATSTTLSAQARVTADATDVGDGGLAVVWSDGHTRFDGLVTARGGAHGGDGGEVEVSGLQLLSFTGTVDTTAGLGVTGNLLIDPAILSIVADKTAGAVDAKGNVSFKDGGTTTTTLLKASTVSNLLATNNLTLQATEVVSVDSAVSGSASKSLTLESGDKGSVAVNADVTIGQLNLIAGSGGVQFGGSTITGALSVESAGGVTQSGALTVTKSTTITVNTVDRGIKLVNDGNDFGGAVTVSTTGGNVLLKDKNALALGTSKVTGDLEVTAGGGVTQSGALTVTKSTTVKATGQDINLGTQDNVFGGAVDTTGANVSLKDVDALDLGASTVTGNLKVTAGGAVTQSGALTVTEATTVNATGQNINLGTQDNVFGGAVDTTGANVTLKDTDALDLGASTVTGNLKVTAGGGVTQSGALAVTEATTVKATGQDINLGTQDNVFGGAVDTTGANVTLKDTDALDLGASTVTGNLKVTAGGAVTQSGALTVTKSTTVKATGQDINLGTQDNNFKDAVATTGANVSLKDTDALNLGASTVTGNLKVTAGGAVTQSGALAVTGKTIIEAAGQNINLGTQDNVFGGAVDTTGANVTLKDTDALDLGASTVTGKLDVTAGGAVTQSGALTVTGATTVVAKDATDAAQNIDLSTQANEFTGAVATTGANVSLKDIDALKLGASTATGDLNVTAGGAVTQSGALTVKGATTVNAGQDIDLSSQNNSFGGVVFANGANVSLKDSDALALGTTTATGNFTVDAGGAVTQSGALAVTKSTTVKAAGQDIDLSTQDNVFGGAVDTTGANVTLKDTDALDLGTTTATGALTVTAVGGIEQTGGSKLDIDGVATFNTGGGDLNLASGDFNDFNAVVIDGVGGKNVDIKAVNIDLGGFDPSLVNSVTVTGDGSTGSTFTYNGTASVANAQTNTFRFSLGKLAANSAKLGNGSNFAIVNAARGAVSAADTNFDISNALSLNGSTGARAYDASGFDVILPGPARSKGTTVIFGNGVATLIVDTVNGSGAATQSKFDIKNFNRLVTGLADDILSGLNTFNGTIQFHGDTVWNYTDNVALATAYEGDGTLNILPAAGTALRLSNIAGLDLLMNGSGFQGDVVFGAPINAVSPAGVALELAAAGIRTDRNTHPAKTIAIDRDLRSGVDVLFAGEAIELGASVRAPQNSVLLYATKGDVTVKPATGFATLEAETLAIFALDGEIENSNSLKIGQVNTFALATTQSDVIFAGGSLTPRKRLQTTDDIVAAFSGAFTGRAGQIPGGGAASFFSGNPSPTGSTFPSLSNNLQQSQLLTLESGSLLEGVELVGVQGTGIALPAELCEDPTDCAPATAWDFELELEFDRFDQITEYDLFGEREVPLSASW